MHSPLFKDLLLFTRDGEWGRAEPAAEHVEMRVVRGTDFASLRRGDLSSIPTRFIPQRCAERKQLQAHDILIETAGGTPEQPTGRTALVKHRHLAAFGVPATCASFARFLRVDTTRADPEYVFWWLQHLYRSGEMERHQVQHTGVARFQFTRFSAMTHVPLPERRNQEAISELLGALEDKIDINRRINESLEDLLRLVFERWFIDFDPVRTGSYLAPALSDVVDVVDVRGLCLHRPRRKADRTLPEGWQLRPFGDLVACPRRAVQPAEVPVTTPYIGLEHMPRRRISLDRWGTATDVTSSKLSFVRGEILFGKLRPYFHKVGIAPVDGVCSADIVVLASRRGEHAAFALMHASSEALIEHVDAASTGTRMPRASWDDIARFEVAVPPVPVLEAFQHTAEPLLQRLIANIHESRTLAELRDCLLPRLLSGQLRARDATRVVQAIT